MRPGAEGEDPVQMQYPCSGETPGRDLHRQEQEIERMYRRQLAKVDDVNAKAPHLAV